jgi:hypothetical protein
MDALSYVTDQEIMDKIKNHDDMTSEEKLQLRETIVSMNKEEQIELFKFLIECLDYEFYSINGPKLLFNLGSLNNNTLWKLHYHIKLLKEDTKRKEIIEQANAAYNDDIAKLNQSMNNKLEEMHNISTNNTEYKPKIYNSNNLPSYQVLMNEALGGE